MISWNFLVFLRFDFSITFSWQSWSRQSIKNKLTLLWSSALFILSPLRTSSYQINSTIILIRRHFFFNLSHKIRKEKEKVWCDSMKHREKMKNLRGEKHEEFNWVKKISRLIPWQWTVLTCNCMVNKKKEKKTMNFHVHDLSYCGVRE